MIESRISSTKIMFAASKNKQKVANLKAKITIIF